MASLPDEWTCVAAIAVGGLTEIGFPPGNELHLLVVSWQGRGVVNTQTGLKIARDRHEPRPGVSWIDERHHTVNGIGPLTGTAIPCVGLWGGKLPERADGWRMDLDTRRGGEEIVLIDERTTNSWLLANPLTEVRAFGFSPSGRFIVVATSADIELYHRRA